MPRRLLLLTLPALVIVALLLPAGSQAGVQVDQISNDADPVPLANFKTAKCRRASKKGALLKFTATSKYNGYRLDVDLFKRGREHFLQYGEGSQFTVRGPAGSFSNLNKPPNSPPGGGAIAFNRKGTRMGLGFSPAFNESISAAVQVGGGLTCKYPKKKRRRR